MIPLANFTEQSTGPDVESNIRGRRSIRSYRSERPSDEVLNRLFESAALAPSAHNRQPWRYCVVSGSVLKQELAKAMGARLATDRRRDGDSAHAIEADIARSAARITGAPIVIIVALTLSEMDRYPDKARSNAEYLMAVQSTAMATQNLLLAAHAADLGACWMCGPLFCPTEVRAVLRLPDDWQPQGLLTLGYPKQSGKFRPRKETSAFVRIATDG
jgi:coenzyme F420-0:L-glutamate ligase / coenzyme F420-1:gamma-L-glutamate ligase